MTPLPDDSVTATSVEHVVRKHLSEALGGARGMVEAALPTLAFTVVFLTTHQLKQALIVAIFIGIGAPLGATRAAVVNPVCDECLFRDRDWSIVCLASRPWRRRPQ